MRIIRHLTAHLKLGLSKGWFEAFEKDGPEELDNSIVVDEGEFPLSLSFAGDIFPFSDHWVPVSEDDGSDENEVAQFVESHLAKAPGLSSVEVVKLLCPEDQKAWGESPVNPAIPQSLEWSYSRADAIKHVITMKLGQGYIHYYLEDDKPSELKLFYAYRSKDGLCASTGPPDSLVEGTLRSDLVKAKLLALWQAQSPAPQ